MTKEKKDIYSALLNVQSETLRVKKDSNNPHFRSKYADLESVMTAVRDPLIKEGVLLIQQPLTEEYQAGCLTRLVHVESDTSVDNELLLPTGKGDVHAIGSCITYARRYSLMTLLGLVPSEEDDGNAAIGKTPEKKPQPNPQNKGMNQGGSWPKVEKPESLKTPLAEDDVLDTYTIPSKAFPDSEEIKIRFKYDLTTLPESRMGKAMEYIRKMQNEGYVDYTNDFVESEIELPNFKNYRIDLVS